MAANGKRTKTKQLTVEVSEELHARLVAEAEQRDVSLRWLVARMLGEAVYALRPVETFTLTRPMRPDALPFPIGSEIAPEVVPDDGE